MVMRHAQQILPSAHRFNDGRHSDSACPRLIQEGVAYDDDLVSTISPRNARGLSLAQPVADHLGVDYASDFAGRMEGREAASAIALTQNGYTPTVR